MQTYQRVLVYTGRLLTAVLFFNACSSVDQDALKTYQQQILEFQKEINTLKQESGKREEKINELKYILEQEAQRKKLLPQYLSELQTAIFEANLEVVYKHNEIHKKDIPKKIVQDISDSLSEHEEKPKKYFLGYYLDQIVENAPTNSFKDEVTTRALAYSDPIHGNLLVITGYLKQSINYPTGRWGDMPIGVTYEGMIGSIKVGNSTVRLEEYVLLPDKDIAIFKLPEKLKNRAYKGGGIGDISGILIPNVFTVCGQDEKNNVIMMDNISANSFFREDFGLVLAEVTTNPSFSKNCGIIDENGKLYGIIVAPAPNGLAYFLPIKVLQESLPTETIFLKKDKEQKISKN